jgi:NADH-quinone oxidoreductase subunit J
VIANFAMLSMLVAIALWAVMTRSLLRAAMALALVSAILTMIMFRLHAPLAAVFELSVCAGLIPVVFISSISLTQPLSRKEKIEHMKARFARFWFLPVILLLSAIVIGFINIKSNAVLLVPETAVDVRTILWRMRPLDLIGQVVMLLVGVFGIVVLFKEKK